MFSNVVRFDDDSESSRRGPTLRGETHPAPKTQAMVESPKRDVGVPPGSQEAGDLAWMQGMIDQQLRLFEAAQRERALAVAELKRIAQTLCRYAWDARLRAGERLEEWPPNLIADLIIQSVQVELRRASLSQNPQLADRHSAVLAELAEARTELHSLRQRLQATEAALQTARSATARDAQDKPAKDRHAANEADSVKPLTRGQADKVAVMPQDRAGAAPVDVAVENSSTERTSERVDDVVRLMAASGLCRWKDITAALGKQWDMRSSAGTIDKVIKKAVGLGLVSVIEVRLEWGGKPTGKMLTLTEAGTQRALALGVKSAESQYTRGMALHKDRSHFYAILEVASILANHYTDVDCFSPGVVLDNGRYFPDLVAVKSDGDRIFVEVERATYKDDQDREAKWLRAAAANQGTVFLATPNQESMLKIVEEIEAIRQQYPHQIRRIMALNVRGYRDGEEQEAASPWVYQA